MERAQESKKTIEPLFKKSTAATSYMTLDGPVHERTPAAQGAKKAPKNATGLDPVTAGSLDASYQALSETVRQRTRPKNQIQSASRFFVLEKAS